MRRRDFLSGTMQALLAGGSLGPIGCGTLMYPERHGQPHSRDIDWKVVALDGLGLVLFFVPGVIAFVVDFATGSIYLPPEPCPPGSPSHPCPPPNALSRIEVAPTELDARKIEAVVAEHAGKRIVLERPGSRVSPLPALARYPEQCRRHWSDRDFGSDAEEFLAQLRPA